ncbi:MAG: Cna B-type domain-containing protein, partial [Bacillota bacterium]|nr:Cna B-type domain-containing protein [Bacillota bacterium]
KEIQYSVTDSVTGYTTGYDEAGNLTNTFDQGSKEITGSKSWTPASLAQEIYVGLFADGVWVKNQLTSGGTFKFEDLPVWKAENGTRSAIVYTVREMESETDQVGKQNGETISYGENSFVVTITDSYSILNTLEQDYTGLEVTKRWVDGQNAAGTRPGSITVQLLQDGQVMNGYENVVVTAPNPDNGSTWTYDFEGAEFPVYKADRINKHVYTVEEVNVADNYSTTHSGMIITNTIQAGATTVTAAKGWEAPENVQLPDSITVGLYADGNYERAIATAVITPDAGGNWSHTFGADEDGNPDGSLPEFDADGDGHKIAYTVRELDTEGNIVTDGNNVKYDGRSFAVSYNDEDYAIVNTYAVSMTDTYSYMVRGHYTVYIDGQVRSAATETLARGSGYDPINLQVDPGDYSSSCTAISGDFLYQELLSTLTIGAGSEKGISLTAGQGNVISVDEENQMYVVDLYYQRTEAGSTPPPERERGGNGNNDDQEEEEEEIIIIPEEGTPLADVPVVIPEEEVPLGNVPQTGDRNMAIGWLMAALASMSGLAALALSGRRKKTGEAE